MNTNKLSRTIAHLLRHAPEQYEVTLDASGWVHISKLAEALTTHFGNTVTVDTILNIAAVDSKQRFTVSGEFIRAAQGHSFPVELGLEPKTPPMTLFHGTTAEAASAILIEGLKSMSRQFVHLSENISTATQVGSRRGKPVILTVNASEAATAGVSFFQAANGVWLVKQLPAEFINLG